MIAIRKPFLSSVVHDAILQVDGVDVVVDHQAGKVDCTDPGLQVRPSIESLGLETNARCMSQQSAALLPRPQGIDPLQQAPRG